MGLDPSPVHLSLTPPCGRHKWMVPYGKESRRPISSWKKECRKTQHSDSQMLGKMKLSLFLIIKLLDITYRPHTYMYIYFTHQYSPYFIYDLFPKLFWPIWVTMHFKTSFGRYYITPRLRVGGNLVGSGRLVFSLDRLAVSEIIKGFPAGFTTHGQQAKLSE